MCASDGMGPDDDMKRRCVMNITTWICLGVIGTLLLIGLVSIWRCFYASGEECRRRKT